MASETTPPTSHQPNHVRDNAEMIAVQCTRVKQELYKLKEYIDVHPHAKVRAEAQALFMLAFNACQNLQTHISSR